MARNLKKDYIKKLINLEVGGGYKLDLANYIHNPNCTHDYPTFVKVISDDGVTVEEKRIYYIKRYDGTGSYMEESYTYRKDQGNWVFLKDIKKKELESANRFNLNKLVSFCK